MGTLDEDGVPPWIELGQHEWKGHEGKANPRYGLRLWRNYVNPKFCPVTWLLLYIKYSEHPETGPVFGRWVTPPKPKGEPAADGADAAAADGADAAAADGADTAADGDAGLGVDALPLPGAEWKPFTESWWRDTSVRLHQEAGYYVPAQGKYRTDTYVPPDGVKNHGIRASAAQWAARCGASLIQIKNMGRWQSTDTCAHYVAQGNEARDLATQGKKGQAGEMQDPIKSVWWWNPVASRPEGGRDQGVRRRVRQRSCS